MRNILFDMTDPFFNYRNIYNGGFQGEHNATQITFNIEEDYKTEDYKYIANIETVDNLQINIEIPNLILNLSSSLTANTGVLKVQLTILKNENLIFKSNILLIKINESISTSVSSQVKINIINARINDEGHLIISLENGEEIDAGFAKGEQGSSYTLTDTDKQEVASKLSAEIIKGLIEHTIEALEIPEGTVKVSGYQFQNDTQLRRVVAPDSLEDIGIHAFEGCFRLTGVEGLKNLKTIKNSAFYGCFSLTDLVLPETIEEVGDQAFMNCHSLHHEELNLVNCVKIANLAFGSSSCKSLKLSSKLTTLGGLNPFSGFTNLEFVDLGTDFNCNGLTLSMSTKYSVDTLVGVLNSLKDRTGETAYTLTLGATNLAKLTDEQTAIATNKNWVLK